MGNMLISVLELFEEYSSSIKKLFEFSKITQKQLVITSKMKMIKKYLRPLPHHRFGLQHCFLESSRHQCSVITIDFNY